MPSQLRANDVCLVTLRTGEAEVHSGVSSTFRSAYKLALFEQGISFPNLPERAALTAMNRNGQVFLWDTGQFQYEEEARWSPIGKMAIIQKIKVKR